jgi:hypothetical protein
MKFLIIACVFLIVLVQSYNIPTATHTYDLEVLCFDNINKDIHLYNTNLYDLRLSHQGERQRRSS